MAYRKVLLAVDSGDNSMNAAIFGMDLARRMNAEVALIFVVDISKSKGNPDAGISEDDALLIAKKEGEQTLDSLSALFSDKKLIKLMPEGHPRIEILKAATIWEADVIVIGNHRKSGVLSLLEGSIAGYLLSHSTIPILMVPSKRQK